MLAARRAATPPQLKERGLVLDESSLWRDRVLAAYVADLTDAPEHAEPAPS